MPRAAKSAARMASCDEVTTTSAQEISQRDGLQRTNGLDGMTCRRGNKQRQLLTKSSSIFARSCSSYGEFIIFGDNYFALNITGRLHCSVVAGLAQKLQATTLAKAIPH